MDILVYSFFALGFASTCTCQREQGQKQSGKYNVKITSVNPCEERQNSETEQMGFFKTKITKFTRTGQCYTGVLALPFGLTDDMQERWEIFSKGSTGGWKRFMTFKNKKACSDKKRLFPEWFNLLENAQLNDTSCPIPRGNYTFDCLDLRTINFKQAPVMTYGQYKAKVNFFHNKVNIGCTDYEADIYNLEDVKSD